MQKKFTSFIVIAFVSLCIWILWSANTEANTLLRKKKHTYYIEGKKLTPNRTFCEKTPHFVIMVTSYVGHVELRSAHRKAMPQDLLKSINATRVFLLAEIPPNEKNITQADIENEHSMFNDILQGLFVENYRNLTQKHFMGLNWTSHECNPIYILKVDDDTVFSLESTYKLLLKLGIRQDLLLGYMLNNTVPQRNRDNKWFVTENDFVGNKYPAYLSGWYYITTSTTAKKLCDEAVYHYFWIDDLFFTGMLREIIGIKLTHVPENFWLEYYELLECCMTDMVKKSIRCDYVVGPNGGRNNLILEYNEAIRHCDAWRNCTVRPETKPLKQVCVVNGEREIFSDGHGEVQFVKS